MTKKIISLFTLAAFCVFSFSCTTPIREVRKIPVAAEQIKGQIVAYGVQTRAGKYIEFMDEDPGVLKENSIKGYKKNTELIEKNQIRDIKKHVGSNYIIVTNDGRQYKGHLSSESKYVSNEYISIPLSDIDLVWIKRLVAVNKFSTGKTIALMVVAGAVGALLISASKPKRRPMNTTTSSCPFVYSFDGTNYIFDAEPYGGAYTKGLQRTDWSGLEHLKEVDGKYSILVSNELEETQYTDELKLVVVDHPEEVKVAPDLSGRIHTVFDPVAPLFAYDGNGKDLLPYIEKNDRVFWVSDDKDMSLKNRDSLKEELIFEFPKPVGAGKVKLLVNACTTLWGSEAGKRYLELYGKGIDDWYEEIDNFGPARSQLFKMNVREELSGLQIRVDTGKDWKSKGMILGGGPLASEDRVYSIDVSDVTGDTLRIKLTPPRAFWMINYLAVDYTQDLPISVTEVEAVEAIDHTGQDVSGLLTGTDNQYLAMPNIGDSAKIVFISPPKTASMNRTIFLKANGYYNIHLQSVGEPQYELLNRIHTEPGFAIKKAYKEYVNWKKENMKKIGKK